MPVFTKINAKIVQYSEKIHLDVAWCGIGLGQPDNCIMHQILCEVAVASAEESEPYKLVKIIRNNLSSIL